MIFFNPLIKAYRPFEIYTRILLSRFPKHYSPHDLCFVGMFPIVAKWHHESNTTLNGGFYYLSGHLEVQF